MKKQNANEPCCKSILTTENLEMDRRRFLWGSATTLASLALPSFLGRSALAADGIPQLSGSPTTFIYVFLRGAADGLSILPPKAGTPDHAVYTAARPAESVRVKDPVALGGTNGNLFALHPSAKHINRLYNAGSLAFVAGAGSTNPTRSHFTQQDLVESGTPTAASASQTGFLNRAVGAIATDKKSAYMPAASLSAQLAYSLRGASAALAVPNLSTGLAASGVGAQYTARERLQALWSLVHPGQGATEALVRQKGNQARNGTIVMEEAAKIPATDTSISPLNTSLDNPTPAYHYAGLSGFRDAVKLLRTDNGIRVMTIDVGSWDFHTNMGTNEGQFNNILTRLDNALGAMARDLGGIPGQRVTRNLWNNVCVVIQTEFGRRVEQNIGQGLDHGRGGVMMIAGGRVNGKQIVKASNYGLVTLDSGDIPVSIDYRTVVGEVLTKHLGVSSLTSVFPGFSLSSLNLIKS